MSVVIHAMNLPKDCKHCRLAFRLYENASTDLVCVPMSVKTYEHAIDRDGEKRTDCPLAAVPGNKDWQRGFEGGTK